MYDFKKFFKMNQAFLLVETAYIYVVEKVPCYQELVEKEE